MPRTIVAGNWKMHKTAADTEIFFDAFLPHMSGMTPEVDVVVAPPFTALTVASVRTAGTRIALGAQTMHWEVQGPYTGEVSAPMLLEHGVSYVILGHSERRAYCGEIDSTVNLKVATALAQGLTPIVAVGETGEQRKAGLTDSHVVGQVRAALERIDRDEFGRIVIAYEPIWAIGTGQNCDPSEADRVMGIIRGSVDGLESTPILYGGSMKAENVASYMAQPNINGGLIGGASLDPDGFAMLIANAAR